MTPFRQVDINMDLIILKTLVSASLHKCQRCLQATQIFNLQASVLLSHIILDEMDYPFYRPNSSYIASASRQI